VLFSTCSNTDITGRYELSGGRTSYTTPVLTIPQIITLKPDGTFNSSTLLSGTFKMNKGRCSLITSDNSTELSLKIIKSVFGGVRLHYSDEVYYKRIKH